MRASINDGDDEYNGNMSGCVVGDVPIFGFFFGFDKKCSFYFNLSLVTTTMKVSIFKLK